MAAAKLAESQWIAQLSNMRAALADLKLPTADQPYTVDYDELSDSLNSGDDVWDFIDDTEEDEYSGDLEEDELPPAVEDGVYGQEWVQAKCVAFAASKGGLSAENLQEQITSLLASDISDEELQSALTDVIGYDDFD
ncbi:hypothetical protein O988_01027, partial [Pseudogymnoascus sp. VKM F-3808]